MICNCYFQSERFRRVLVPRRGAPAASGGLLRRRGGTQSKQSQERAAGSKQGGGTERRERGDVQKPQTARAPQPEAFRVQQQIRQRTQPGAEPIRGQKKPQRFPALHSPLDAQRRLKTTAQRGQTGIPPRALQRPTCVQRAPHVPSTLQPEYTPTVYREPPIPLWRVQNAWADSPDECDAPFQTQPASVRGELLQHARPPAPVGQQRAPAPARDLNAHNSY